MARQITEITIFISCPSNLSELRNHAEAAIKEVSSILEATSNVTLRYLNWREDIVPGVSSDGQQVINQQTIRNYDVYLGMLGSRFGTPTPRAGSGTEEEFDIALNQFEADPKSIRILFYLQAFGANPFSIDPSQLAKVVAFKNKLESLGVLYKELVSLNEALSSIKSHLLKLIHNDWNPSTNSWKDNLDSIVSDTYEIKETALLKPQESTEFGLLDLQELAAKEIGLAGSCLTNLSSHLEKLTVLTANRTNALAPEELTLEEKKEIMEAFASDIETFASSTRGELANLRVYLASGSEHWELFYKIIHERKMEIAEPASAVIAAVEAVEPGLRFLRNAAQEAKASFGQVPPMTRSLIIAGRSLTTTFDDVVLELTIALERFALLKSRLSDYIR